MLLLKRFSRFYFSEKQLAAELNFGNASGC